MCHGPCPVVLQLCVTYAASVAPSANLFFAVTSNSVTSFVSSRLDYGSVTLNVDGITRRLIYRLQSVLNAAERLVYNSRKYDRITPLLRDLH